MAAVAVARGSSGALLREARTRAGLSQAELAARAGVAQSVISVYESGRRQPALATLTALVEATGFDLDVQLRRRGLARLTGPLGMRLRRHRAEVLRVARTAGISVRGVFGSVARGEDGPDSDVDLLVDLPSGMGLFGLARVQERLQQILDAPVELIPAADLEARRAARGAGRAGAAVSRRDVQRLEDIRAACAAIRAHLTHGDLQQGLIFDAVRARLIEIGEAVKAIDPELLAAEADIPWGQIARMRDQLAHRYFDTSHAIVAGTVTTDLPQLEAAVDRLMVISETGDQSS